MAPYIVLVANATFQRSHGSRVSATCAFAGAGDARRYV
jgi:hypothetical protein